MTIANLTNQLNGLAMDEEYWDEIMEEHRSEVLDAIDDLSILTLPTMTPEQQAIAEAGLEVGRRLF